LKDTTVETLIFVYLIYSFGSREEQLQWQSFVQSASQVRL
jgi:hypothetical protein